MLLEIFKNKKNLLRKPKYSLNAIVLEKENVKCINCKRNIEVGEFVFETGRFNKC